MYPQHNAIINRDCEAIQIPEGIPVTVPTGSLVTITQALGNSYTVNVNGNLVRIDGKDADALGLQSKPSPTSSRTEDDTVDETLVIEQLKTCYDPEIPINIVDLGLIYEQRIEPIEGNKCKVYIKMTLTAPGCGMGPFLVADVNNKLSAVPNIEEVDVELVFDPPWDQSRMSDAAKLQAGLI